MDSTHGCTPGYADPKCAHCRCRPVLLLKYSIYESGLHNSGSHLRFVGWQATVAAAVYFASPELLLFRPARIELVPFESGSPRLSAVDLDKSSAVVVLYVGPGAVALLSSSKKSVKTVFLKPECDTRILMPDADGASPSNRAALVRSQLPACLCVPT